MQHSQSSLVTGSCDYLSIMIFQMYISHAVKIATKQYFRGYFDAELTFKAIGVSLN